MTGILPINKGINCTSFLAVKRVMRLTGEKKCGHTGTLDPMATGVLPMALGGATRFIPLLPDHTKKYTASFRLGLRSDTEDIWGEVTGQKAVLPVETVRQCLPALTGDILQVPPMYSARKIDGVRLYDLARKGIEVERTATPCTVYRLEVCALPDGDYSLAAECSAGTYIRTLISDLGEMLGCGAVMTSLCRTAACGFSLSQCLSTEELETACREGTLGAWLLPVDEALQAYPAVRVTVPQGTRFQNGGALSRERISAEGLSGLCRVYSEERFLGLGNLEPGSEELRVARIFSER